LWISKSFISPKLTYRFNTIPIKILAKFFVYIGKIILLFIWKGKEIRTAKFFEKNND
jgi:hypothetical protein